MTSGPMRDIYNELVGDDGSRLLDSFVVYIDVLGTRDALAKETAAVDAYFSRFRKARLQAREIAGTDDPGWVTSTAFSDLMFIALPVRRDGEAELQSVFKTASLFQFFLAIEGFFVRGASREDLLGSTRTSRSARHPRKRSVSSRIASVSGAEGRKGRA